MATATRSRKTAEIDGPFVSVSHLALANHTGEVPRISQAGSLQCGFVTGLERRASVARLPQLRPRVETGLLATAFDQYRPCFQTAGMPALDQVSRAVRLWLLLEIYGFASRQSEVFALSRAGQRCVASSGERTARENKR